MNDLDPAPLVDAVNVPLPLIDLSNVVCFYCRTGHLATEDCPYDAMVGGLHDE